MIVRPEDALRQSRVTAHSSGAFREVVTKGNVLATVATSGGCEGILWS